MKHDSGSTGNTPLQLARPRRYALGAGELAGAMLRVSELGFAVRARGLCLGTDLARRLRIVLPAAGHYARTNAASLEFAVVEELPAAGRLRHRQRAFAVEHARGGHDEGCYGFGIALSELARVGEAWALSPGVAAYVHDGFREAAPRVVRADAWAAELAREAVEHSLRGRITPLSVIRKAGLRPSSRRPAGDTRASHGERP